MRQLSFYDVVMHTPPRHYYNSARKSVLTSTKQHVVLHLPSFARIIRLDIEADRAQSTKHNPQDICHDELVLLSAVWILLLV